MNATGNIWGMLLVLPQQSLLGIGLFLMAPPVFRLFSAAFAAGDWHLIRSVVGYALLSVCSMTAFVYLAIRSGLPTPVLFLIILMIVIVNVWLSGRSHKPVNIVEPAVKSDQTSREPTR